MWETPFKGVKFADIGRIASKHVKVTVSHKNSNNSKERPVTSPKYQSDAMMQQKERDDATAVKDGDIQKVEDMDTSPQDGKYSY